MWGEFRRTALLPLLVAAVFAGLVAWGASQFGTNDTIRIGGSFGSTLLQARSRDEERQRAYAILRMTLEQLCPTFESELNLINDPIATDDGRLTTNAALLTRRARRVCDRLLDLCKLSPLYKDDLNHALASLRESLELSIPFLDAAIEFAKAVPQTVEEFFIPLVMYKNRDIATKKLVEQLSAVRNTLGSPVGVRSSD